MSWSLQVNNGDLSLGGKGGFATVSGQAKLVQDLKHWILSPQGSDPMHPEYGSLIDGGITPEGEIIDPMLGNLLTSEFIADVEGEIRRCCGALQQQQLSRLNEETLRYGGKTTLSRGEILSSVDDVVLQQEGTFLISKVFITSADNIPLSITQAV